MVYFACIWLSRISYGAEIRIIPESEDFEFNPNNVKIIWSEDYHRVNFRFRTKTNLQKKLCSGEINVYVGPLQICCIPFTIIIGASASKETYKLSSAVVGLYRKIFVSYSHLDEEIVKACTQISKALGDAILIDSENLRSGEQWKQALEGLIDGADIFQLFRSKNAAQSESVKKEWQYALNKQRENNFIRPIYWDKNAIDLIPMELKHLHFKFLPDLNIQL
jgi:hypothetical protein